MTRRSSRMTQGRRNQAALAQRVFAIMLLGWLAPARAQVTLPLNVNGTLVVAGGGSNAGVVTYTTLTFTAAPALTTIALSAGFNTLVIRGGNANGASCSNGGDWCNNDFFPDSKCCCN